MIRYCYKNETSECSKPALACGLAFYFFCYAVPDSRGTGSDSHCCLSYLAGRCLLACVGLLFSDVRMGFLQDLEHIFSRVLLLNLQKNSKYKLTKYVYIQQPIMPIR